MANSHGGYYPPVGFHFKVMFLGFSNDNDTRFQSVSGLNMEVDVETFKEGGENRFEHKLPGRTKYSDLVLKRGLLTDSLIIKWVMGFVQLREYEFFKPLLLHIHLLNENHETLKLWHVVDAWPKKWTISDFNAQENAVVIESLEISYKYFIVM